MSSPGIRIAPEAPPPGDGPEINFPRSSSKSQDIVSLMTATPSFFLKQVSHHTMLSEVYLVLVKAEPGPPGLMLNLAVPVFLSCKSLHHFRSTPHPTVQSSVMRAQT